MCTYGVAVLKQTSTPVIALFWYNSIFKTQYIYIFIIIHIYIIDIIF